MGGKALNKYGVFTERKPTDEFKQIGYELTCRTFFDLGIFSEVVKCYHTKESHGDLDLLLKIRPEDAADFRKYINEAFKPNAIHNNGGVFSFDYKNFQVDFIPIKEDRWKVAGTYYSYDPLGNIMGKTFHKLGMSYGWDGLHYKYRNSHGTNSANILLTKDPKAIFDMGGYDYERYCKGFDTLEDIFKFVIESKYFDAEMFEMENLKSIDKKRNRKRGSYHLFLNYLKDNGIKTKYKFDSKDNYLLDIDVAFPEVELLYRLHDLYVEDENRKALAEKFNGELVMSWIPELKGKELGAAMTKFKELLGEGFDSFIRDSGAEEIKACFIKYYDGRG